MDIAKEEHVIMKIGNDIYYVGVNDHQIDLFEGQYVVISKTNGLKM